MSSNEPPAHDGPPLLTDMPGPHQAPGTLGIDSLLADRYRITGILGDGGMGAVYLAEHAVLGKRVAIKVLKPELTHDSTLVERFFREARATATVEHENVVDILDFGQTPDYAFFAMEALEGRELADIVGGGRCIGWARAKPIIVQIARALGAAHRAGIVHRDMKPGNVFLIARSASPDFVKVLDFGIAKIDDGVQLTQAGMVFGTAAYMAPEQASGDGVDGRTDIYALGCMAFEMLTGRVPFPGDNFIKVLGQHIGEHPPSLRDVAPQLDVPAQVVNQLEALIAKMLAKYPQQRHADMADLERAVLELDGALPAGLDHGAPLPPSLMDGGGPGYGGGGYGPDQDTAGLERPASPTASTAMMPGMGASSIDDLSQSTLTPIAYLFVAFAHGADGVLTKSEMRALADRLRHWGPQVGLDGIGHVLREAVSSYGSSTNKPAQLDHYRAQLATQYPPATLARLVMDLREIASADGRISDGEQRFVSETAQAFGLESDQRLSSLAFMYLALGSAAGGTGTIAATEMKVLGEQLRQWAPGASMSETAAALREAVNEYKRLAGLGARLDRARAAAESLRGSTDAETLRRVLADLWRIAGADGHISPDEQRFIMDMVERFGAGA